jgi:hypothetical protein
VPSWFPKATRGQTASAFARSALGYPCRMSDRPETEGPSRRPHAIWSEALWSIGLIGIVMVLTLIASVLGRV